MANIELKIDLFEHIGTSLIVSWPSNVFYCNQTGGHCCLQSEYEGILVPIGNRFSYTEQKLESPEVDLSDYFCGPPHRGQGATYEGLSNEDVDFVNSVLQKYRLDNSLSVNLEKLSSSHEAWIYMWLNDLVNVGPYYNGFAPYPREAVLTWENSD